MSAGGSQNLPGRPERAHAVAGHPSAPDDDGLGDPNGQAVPEAAPLEDMMSHFAEYVVNRLFSVGLSLESAHSMLRGGPAAERVAAATEEVDRLIRDIRATMLSLAGDPMALLKERAVHTAWALRAAALDAATLLEQQGDLARRPGKLDYPTEIKRWRAFADQAEQMAKRWEQRP
jgi:hypothetical protein